jgi:hypothetical protein
LGRYIRAPPIKSRSLYDIYQRKLHPEYSGGKPFDQYGKFIEKYHPNERSTIEHSPKSQNYHEHRIESAEHPTSTSEADNKDKAEEHAPREQSEQNVSDTAGMRSYDYPEDSKVETVPKKRDGSDYGSYEGMGFI